LFEKSWLEIIHEYVRDVGGEKSRISSGERQRMAAVAALGKS
jgi:hypothetical protein